MTNSDDARTALPWRLRLARLALWWEAAWPALWPPLGLCGTFLVLALAEVPQALPQWAHYTLLVAFLGALAGTLWRAWPQLRPPRMAAAMRRLERDSGLSHRPLSVLADRPCHSDAVAALLWREHQRRAMRQLAQLRLAPPRSSLARVDRHALRAALLIALIAAVVMSGAEAPARLARAVMPASAPAALPSPPIFAFEGWITPPAYTGAAPILLDPAGGAVTAPLGSRLSVTLSGSHGSEIAELLLDGQALPMRPLDAQTVTGETTLGPVTRLALRRGGREVARWALTLTPDRPPEAAWDQPPGRVPRGVALRLPWRAEDDWGLAAVRVEFRLTARLDAPPLVLELPVPPGGGRSLRGVAHPDLSAHPWAGLEVEARLIARDRLDQEGHSPPVLLTLPERSFDHPVAQALIALRKALSRDPSARAAAQRELDRISAAPEAFEHASGIFLALRAARHRLSRDRRPQAVEEVQAILWDVALALEEGRSGRTARALAEAQQALRDALQRLGREGGALSEADRDELERRIAALREAIAQHLAALAEELRREHAEAFALDPQSLLFDQRALERHLQRLAEALRRGHPEAAERLLAELEAMLRALQERRAIGADERQRREGQNRGRQQMGVVQDLVRRQAGLLDRAYRRAEEAAQQQRQSRSLPRQDGSGQQAAREAASAEDARLQRALRRALGELMQQFAELAGEVPEALGEADQAMRQAAEALSTGSDPQAAQARAIRALTEGGRQMARQIERRFGRPEPGEGEASDDDGGALADQGGGDDGRERSGDARRGRDPLGRRLHETLGFGEGVSGETHLPTEVEMLKTHRLQEELRRRAADRKRPSFELEYLERLLRRF